MEPFVDDADFKLFRGDALETLRTLPAETVHCALISPPFFGLRDYGVEGQIGLEETPEAWAEALVSVFDEVRRVLRKDGTLLIECGDSYASGTGRSYHRDYMDGGATTAPDLHQPVPRFSPGGIGLKPKDLIGQPFLLAFALRAAGWYWRGCYIWAKPNAMPESARDRCTTSHSYVLHFSKSARYFWDPDAIAEPAEWARWGDQTTPKYEGTDTASGWMQPKKKAELREGVAKANGAGRLEAGRSGTIIDGRALGGPAENARKNARSVWNIPTHGFPGMHFATWPEKLAERIILAGTSERGCCPECGAPWERETEVEQIRLSGSTGSAHNVNDHNWSDVQHRTCKSVQTTGWRPTCEHGQEPIGCIVLDPFMGSGTTALVARRLGRRSIGIELSEEYARLSVDRTRQLSLLATEATA